MKPLLPFVLAAALVPGAPSHAAPRSPFKVVKKVDGTASRIVMTGAKSGFAFFLARESQRPLAYRWNGRTWRSSPLPPLFGSEAEMKIEAAASGPSNVWAVVSAEDDGVPMRNRVLRWNGKRWLKGPSFSGARLDQIAVLGRKNVWVFGADGRTGKARSWHYDGRTWHRKNVPGRRPERLTVRTGANRIWAIDEPWGRGVLRWTGTRWKDVAIPLPGGASRWEPDALDVHGRRVTVSFLRKDTGTGDGTPPESRIATWNGQRWRVENPPARRGRLRIVLSDGRGGLWALGSDDSSPDPAERLHHRTAQGPWTTRVLPYGDLNTYADDLTRLPGTRHLIGVASTYLVHEYGRIITTR